MPRAKAGDTVALGKLDDGEDRRHADLGQGRHARLAQIDPAAAGLLLRAAAEGAQGRRQAVGRHAAHGRGGPVAGLRHNQDSAETVLSGHGEMHLRVAVERLEGRNQIAIESRAPAVPYRETIRKACRSAAATRSSRAATASSATSSRHQAAAARLGLRIHRHDHRRRRAQAVHPLGREGRARLSSRPGRSASRWSMSRSTCPTAPTTPSIPPTWRSRWRQRSP
jgi:hypothetical protein